LVLQKNRDESEIGEDEILFQNSEMVEFSKAKGNFIETETPLVFAASANLEENFPPVNTES
jgi:hypothetical protein